MRNIISISTLGVLLALTAPAMAQQSEACKASWSKMDTGNTGYSSSAAHMAAMKSANLRTAAEDKMTAKEYMDACEKGTFSAINGK